MKKLLINIFLVTILFSCTSEKEIILTYEYLGNYQIKTVATRFGDSSELGIYELYVKGDDFRSIKIDRLPVATPCDYPTQSQLERSYFKRLRLEKEGK